MSITALAAVNVLRMPGRALVGAISLAVGVSALTMLTAVIVAFRGVLVASLLAIARALINTPSLLLADEPTGNLDSANAAEILQLLRRLRQDHKMTIILAMHDPQVAAHSERLIRLRDGAIIDDIELTDGYPVEDIIRRVGQLG